ncbi:unnamed protein product [Hymenolepis diminuta]|uniref:Uncharacterized protein n=1 Tax=Hymenolepis diminuta TaxID=6216 RepID=A0A564YCQ7_HYMDI|nr:unnamed protein product [Hymenolepis diminuta]
MIPTYLANRLQSYAIILTGYDFKINHRKTIEFGQTGGLSRLIVTNTYASDRHRQHISGERCILRSGQLYLVFSCHGDRNKARSSGRLSYEKRHKICENEMAIFIIKGGLVGSILPS